MHQVFRRFVAPVTALLTVSLAVAVLWPTAFAASRTSVPNDLPREEFSQGKPEGWTVVNHKSPNGGWTFDNPIGQPNQTKGEGGFALSYQSKTASQTASAQIDSELRTPVLNLSAATDVTLKFSVAYEAYSQDTLKIDVSTDSGESWDTIWTPDTPDPERGWPRRTGDWSLSLTDRLAGKSGVQFRFVHKTNWTYLGPHIFQIDNVEVAAIGTPASPTNPRATANSEQVAVNVAWDFGGTGSVRGFKVERSPDGDADWATVGQTKQGELAFTDYPPECGKTYYYRVAAYNDKFTSDWSGATSATTRSCDLPRIEVNQDVGLAYGRYVAGKDTAVIVYLKDPVKVNDATQTVRVERNGALVTTLTPKARAGLSESIVFMCADRGACGDWAEGTYTFTASINGTTATLSNIKFAARRPIRVLVVPLRVAYAGEVKEVTDPKWREASPLFRKLLPVAPDDFVWETRDGAVDLTAYDLTNFRGRMQAYAKLGGLQDAACNTRAGQKPDNCYDAIVGIRPDDSNLPPSQRLSPGEAMNNIVLSLPGEVVVHELGHTLGLGDEYDAWPRNNPSGHFNCVANPPPSNYLGKPEKTGGPPVQCSDSTTEGFYGQQRPPYGYGVLIPTGAHPFDVGEGSFLEERHLNIMGNYGPRWIHPDTRRYLFDRQAPAEGGAGKRAQSIGATSVLTYTAIALEGVIDRTGHFVSFSSSTFATTDSLPSAEPDAFGLAVRAIGPLSETLYVQSIAVDFDLADHPTDANAGYFAESVPLSDAVTALEIISGTTTLRTIPVTPNTITVHLSEPTPGATLTGTHTVRWTATSSTGAPLTYRVEYAREPSLEDGDNWIELADGLTTTEWTQNFDQLPGSLPAPDGDGLSRIRVTASDGLHTASVVSQGNPVPAKPPQVVIDQDNVDYSQLDELGGPGDVLSLPPQRPPFTYKVGEPVVLTGWAVDPQVGPLDADSSLTWRMEGSANPIGQGETLVLEDLAEGTHHITLTGRNSQGLEGSDSVTVTVLPDSLVTIHVNALGGDELPITTTRFIDISGSTTSAAPSVQVTDMRWQNTGNRASGAVEGTAAHWTIPSLYLENGLNTIVVTAFDSLGDETSEEINIFYDASAEPAWERQDGFVGGRQVEYQVVNGHALFEGHGGGYINLGNPASIPAEPGDGAAFKGHASGTGSLASLWPQVGGVATIPYQIHPNTPASSRPDIEKAVRAFNEQMDGVLRWVERTNQTDYVSFKLDGGPGFCASLVGKGDGEQTIDGDPNCGVGTLVHEMGHAAGIEHEQSRSDRDKYITLKPDNMTAEDLTQWEVNSGGLDLGPYGYGSVMHYGRGYGRPGVFPTFVTIPPGIHIGLPGNSTRYLSDGDVDSLKRLYGKPTNQIVVTTNPPGLRVTVDKVDYVTPQTFNWAIGERHTLKVATDAQKVDEVYYLFGRWSTQTDAAGPFPPETTVTVTAGDGGRTSPTSVPAQTIYIADFKALYPVETEVEPEGAGSITISPLPQSYPGADPKKLYLLADSPVSFTATPSGANQFAYWNNVDEPLGANPKPMHVLRPISVRAVFTTSPVTTIDADPPGLGVRIKVDGKDVLPPARFLWTAGSTHSVEVASPQPNDKEPTRFEFQSWSDGGSRSHTVTAGAANQTVTARFVTKYKVLAESLPNDPPNCAGTVEFNPADTFATAGTEVSFTATAKPGWTFTGWVKGLTGTDNPASLTVERDVRVQARFNNGSTSDLAVTGVNPSSAVAGGSPLEVTLTGTGFTNRTRVQVNSLPGAYITGDQTVTFVSDTQIKFTLQRDELADAGKLKMIVFNPDPANSSCRASAIGDFTVRPRAAGQVATPTPTPTGPTPTPAATRTPTPTPTPGATRYYLYLPLVSRANER